MKKIALFFLLLIGICYADDLFLADGRKKVTRNLIIGNRVYESVQLVGRLPGGKVEIIAKGGRVIVKESQIPTMWSSAMDKREATSKKATDGNDVDLSAAAPILKALNWQKAADEKCLIVVEVLGKSAGGTMMGVVFGFRENRAEVLVTDANKVAWVKMEYFDNKTSKYLRELDIAAVEKAAEDEKKAKEEAAEAESDALAKSKKKIRERAAKEWPGDYRMQVYEIKRQEEAMSLLDQWYDNPPFGLSEDEYDELEAKARKEWPSDYRMQTYEIRRQGEALKQLKSEKP